MSLRSPEFSWAGTGLYISPHPIPVAHLHPNTEHQPLPSHQAGKLETDCLTLTLASAKLINWTYEAFFIRVTLRHSPLSAAVQSWFCTGPTDLLACCMQHAATSLQRLCLLPRQQRHPLQAQV